MRSEKEVKEQLREVSWRLATNNVSIVDIAIGYKRALDWVLQPSPRKPQKSGKGGRR